MLSIDGKPIIITHRYDKYIPFLSYRFNLKG